MATKLQSSSALLRALRKQYWTLLKLINHPELLAGFLYSKESISKEVKTDATAIGRLSKSERTSTILNAVEDNLTESSDPLEVMEIFCTALENCEESSLTESVAYLRAQIATATKHEMEHISPAGDSDDSPNRKKADSIAGKRKKKRQFSDDKKTSSTKKLVAPKHKLEHGSFTDDENGSPARKKADMMKAESACQTDSIPKEKEAEICGKHKVEFVSSDDETPPTKKVVVKSHVSDDEKEESSDESEGAQKSVDTGHKATVQRRELKSSSSVDCESVSLVRKTPDTIAGKRKKKCKSSDDKKTPPMMKLVAPKHKLEDHSSANGESGSLARKKPDMKSHVSSNENEESSEGSEKPQKSADAASKHSLEHGLSVDEENEPPAGKKPDTAMVKTACSSKESDVGQPVDKEAEFLLFSKR